MKRLKGEDGTSIRVQDMLDAALNLATSKRLIHARSPEQSSQNT